MHGQIILPADGKETGASLDRRPLWRVSAGPVWQQSGSVSFRTNGTSSIRDLPPLLQASSSGNSAVGPLGSFGNRQYDDGYVRLSSGTGDSHAIDPTATTNWGYSNAGQIQGNTLNFHATESAVSNGQQSARTSRDGWTGDDDSFGPHLQIDCLFPVAKAIRLGPQLTFSFNSMGVSHTARTFQATQSQTATSDQITDTYNLKGILPPAAPYQGTFLGPGPLIDEIPTSRRIQPNAAIGHGVANGAYHNVVNESFDSDMYNFGLGLGIEADLTTRLYAFASGGFALRVINYDASVEEALILDRKHGKSSDVKRWRDDSSDADALAGGYFQGGLGFRIWRNYSITSFVRYDLLQSLDGAVGASSYHWNASGLSAGVSVAVSF